MINTGSSKGHFVLGAPEANQMHKDKAHLSKELEVKSQKYRGKTKTFTWNVALFHNQDTGTAKTRQKT